MATYKKVNATELNSNLSAIADTIRSKTGKTESLKFPEEFVENIEAISSIDPVFYKYMNRTLTEFSDEEITTIGGHAFLKFSYLTSVDFPNATRIENGSFSKCTLLSIVNVPNVTSVSNSSFSNCVSLKRISLPNAEELGYQTFYNCMSLTDIDLKKLFRIGYQTFRGCQLLSTLVLCVTYAPCTLSTLNAFDDTPFATNGTGGIVLVPRSMIESYQTSTNWSTLYEAGTCLFWAVEDYTLDGSIEGEINWDKLNTDREGAFEIE